MGVKSDLLGQSHTLALQGAISSRTSSAACSYATNHTVPCTALPLQCSRRWPSLPSPLCSHRAPCLNYLQRAERVGPGVQDLSSGGI